MGGAWRCGRGQAGTNGPKLGTRHALGWAHSTHVSPFDGRHSTVCCCALNSRIKCKCWCVCVCLRQGVDISPFINNLPGGTPTHAFRSDDASGSTSQAANIQVGSGGRRGRPDGDHSSLGGTHAATTVTGAIPSTSLVSMVLLTRPARPTPYHAAFLSVLSPTPPPQPTHTATTGGTRAGCCCAADGRGHLRDQLHDA